MKFEKLKTICRGEGEQPEAHREHSRRARTNTPLHRHASAAARLCPLRSADISDGAVQLAVDVAPQNHARALYNMLLAGMVIAILLAFVCVLNYTIWKVNGSCL